MVDRLAQILNCLIFFFAILKASCDRGSPDQEKNQNLTCSYENI